MRDRLDAHCPTPRPDRSLRNQWHRKNERTPRQVMLVCREQRKNIGGSETADTRNQVRGPSTNGGWCDHKRRQQIRRAVLPRSKLALPTSAEKWGPNWSMAKAENGVNRRRDMVGLYRNGPYCEDRLQAHRQSSSTPSVGGAAGRTGFSAQETLREALRQIELRASKITDPAQRATYLAGRPENVRVFSLARDWLGEEEMNQQPTIRMSLP